MMRFRSKPCEVEATQWHPGVEIPGVLEVKFTDGRSCGYAFCYTIHRQQTRIDDGDWVVTEPGDPNYHYPVKPEIFEARWEPIE